MAGKQHELQKCTTATPVALEREEAHERRVLVPSADIYERPDALVVVADVPGVDEGSVEISVERNVMSLEAQAEPGHVADHRLVHGEFETGAYRRSFVLSDEVDVGRIEASVSDGVLRITLPKAEAARPRKITVKAR